MLMIDTPSIFQLVRGSSHTFFPRFNESGPCFLTCLIHKPITLLSSSLNFPSLKSSKTCFSASSVNPHLPHSYDRSAFSWAQSVQLLIFSLPALSGFLTRFTFLVNLPCLSTAAAVPIFSHHVRKLVAGAGFTLGHQSPRVES